MTEQQVAQVASHGRQGVGLFLGHLALGLVQGKHTLPHAHRVISGHIIQGLVDGKANLSVEGLEGVFFGLSAIFGFGGKILAGLNFFAYAAQVRRKL